MYDANSVNSFLPLPATFLLVPGRIREGCGEILPDTPSHQAGKRQKKAAGKTGSLFGG
jgi:hypothetical protein